VEALTLRPRWFAAAFCLALLAASDARAQDPQRIAVQAAAREWLGFVDVGDAQASWGAAGKKFRAAIAVDVWAEALKKEQARLGPVARRTVGPTRFQTTLPGFPDGEYAQVLFNTAFANTGDSRETLSLEREDDGKWRVIGYFPRSK
jgi:opacity protein-like surface antigen